VGQVVGWTGSVYQDRLFMRILKHLLAGQQLLHHKPPAVLQFQVFCFWSARGILTAQATLTQWACISTFIVDLRAEKIAAKFVMVGLPDEDSIR
jgi:hypothetical protein